MTISTKQVFKGLNHKIIENTRKLIDDYLSVPEDDLDLFLQNIKYPIKPSDVYHKTIKMHNIKQLFTTVVYSKEELFFLLKIAEKAVINADAIDPHAFPIAEVLLGEKIVYIPYNAKEKTLEMHVVPTGFTDNFSYDVVNLPDFMHILGIKSPREHILANFVSRKSKHNSKNTVDINGTSYSKDIIEQLLDCNFDDFISNLEYESKMT